MRYPMFREWKREIHWLILRFFRWVTRQSIRNCQAVLDMLHMTENELEKTKKELQKAQDKLKDIERLAESTAKVSAGEMGAGNVPQGRYAYLLAQNDLSNRVLRFLGLKAHKPNKSKLKIVTNWLGRL